MYGGFWHFALSRKNIWHNAPVSKLYRGMPLFNYSITVKASYLNNSTMQKPSCGQVLSMLVFQLGFWAIKYSRVTVCNSSMKKTSYMRNKNQFLNVTSLKLFVFLPLQSTVSLPSSVQSVATASLFSSHRQ